MKKVVVTPEILWRKYIQARPDSTERAGYGAWNGVIGPEFQYEAKSEKNCFYLTVEYSDEYPSLFNVISKIEEKIKETKYKDLNKLPIKTFFQKMEELGAEAREEFERTKENISEYKEFLRINKEWHNFISKNLLSFSKPLISSIPCVELEFKPFTFNFPETGYNEWITHLNFSEFLKKLKNPVASFPEIGDSISYSLYEKFSGNFNGVNAERGLTLRYKNGTFNFSSDEKQQESKSVNFRLGALGNMVPVKK